MATDPDANIGPTDTHPGLGAFPANVGHRIVDGNPVVHLAVGFPFDRHGWYGTPEQAEAFAASLTEAAERARELAAEHEAERYRQGEDFA